MASKKITVPFPSKPYNKTNYKRASASSSGNEHEHIFEVDSERFVDEMSDNLFGDLFKDSEDDAEEEAGNTYPYLFELIENAKEDYPCLSALSQGKDLSELIGELMVSQLEEVLKEAKLACMKWKAREMKVVSCIIYHLVNKLSKPGR